MIKDKNDIFSLNDLIASGYPFAIYRSPREKLLNIITQNDATIFTTKDIEELNGKEGFVIAPFQSSNNNPICLIRSDRNWTISLDDLCCASDRRPSEPEGELCSDDYKKRFEIFIKALKDNRFKKLVLSRNEEEKNNMAIDKEKSFLSACQRYVNSYVYFAYTPLTGAWMGSSPEVLLSNVSGKWMTVALAGTQSLSKGELPQQWDNKNKIEQDVVSTYIRQLLHDEGITLEETKPYSVKAGNLSHLRTDFYFSLPNSEQLGGLLKHLHPTPAVCGLPKQNAYRFILNNEGYDRKYYSGFIGRLNLDDITEIYVNLRCMHFNNSCFTLYAGGGLLASSTLEDEWVETEKKMQTMKNILINK